MVTSFQSFFCAAILLVLCRIWLDVLSLNAQQANLNSAIGWTSQAENEEDSKEFEDDDDTGEIIQAPTHAVPCNDSFAVKSFDASDHIQEVVPPPPQA
jgi:hypothetical protein